MKLTNYIRDAFITSVMDDVPFVDYTELIRAEAVKVAVSLLPPKVQAVYKDKATRDYVATMYCGIVGVGLYVPGLGDENETVQAKLRTELADLIKKRDEQEASRTELRRKLKSIAYSATTRKALAEALPEFAKYLPAETETSRSLPVVANVVSDFVKAGWPKGKKQAVSA